MHDSWGLLGLLTTLDPGYPNDNDIQTLHALRVGLCLKIEQGSITFEQATDIFNRAHDMVIQNAKSERERNGPKL